jgi:hypothetical protein
LILVEHLSLQLRVAPRSCGETGKCDFLSACAVTHTSFGALSSKSG